MSEISDDHADVLLAFLSSEGFDLPFMARARDYFADDDVPGTPEHAAALATLRAADQEAQEENRQALRRALQGASLVVTTIDVV